MENNKTTVSIKQKIEFSIMVSVLVMMAASLILAGGIIFGLFNPTKLTTVDIKIVKITCGESQPLETENIFLNTTEDETLVNSIQQVNTDLKTALATEKNVSLIQNLIIKRKQVLSDLIQINPVKALDSVFTQAELDKVNKYSNNCSEKLNTYDGKVYIDIAENLEKDLYKNLYKFITDDGQKIKLFPTTSPDDIIISNTATKIIGYQLDDKIFFDGMNKVTEEAVKETSGYRVILDESNDKSERLGIGEHKTIILKVNFANTSTNSPERVTIGKVMDNINNYYIENSYNQLNFSGVADVTATTDIYPTNPDSWYKIDVNATCEVGSIYDVYEQAMQKAYDDPDAGVDFTQYDNVVIVAPWQNNNGPCSWAGMATIGEVEMNILGTDPEDEYQMAWATVNSMNFPPTENDPSYNSHFKAISIHLGHELGHNFGNRHAAVLRCNTFITPLSTCTFVIDDEYKDAHEIMGNNAMSHYDALHKEATGWFIDAVEIQTVDTPGTYEIYPIESTDRLKLKALKIPRGDDHYIYVEYRQPIGFDAISVSGSNLVTGALVHTTERAVGFDWPFSNKSYLLDLCGPPYGGCGGWLGQWSTISKNSALQVGNSWTDLEAGVTIQVDSVSDNSVPIEERKLTVSIDITVIECSSNSGCNDNDICTEDICVDVGTTEAYCTHDSLGSECYECVDSEDGSCQDVNGSYGRFCREGNVQGYQCSASGCETVEHQTCMTGCSYGHCNCVDTDNWCIEGDCGGFNWTEVGQCVDDNGIHNESCASANTRYEYFCSDQYHPGWKECLKTKINCDGCAGDQCTGDEPVPNSPDCSNPNPHYPDPACMGTEPVDETQ